MSELGLVLTVMTYGVVAMLVGVHWFNNYNAEYKAKEWETAVGRSIWAGIGWPVIAVFLLGAGLFILFRFIFLDLLYILLVAPFRRSKDR